MLKRRRTKSSDRLLADLKRGHGLDRPGLAAEPAFPSAAALAGMTDLAFNTKNAEGKVFLGAVNATMERSGGRLSPQGGDLLGIKDDRHMAIVAGSRAGKGVSLLLPILATWPGSVICIDPKLDLATETAALRARTQSVQVIDPFGASGPSCDPYRAAGNPLSYAASDDPDDLIDTAMLVADALIALGDKDPHWDVSAQMFLESIALHVMTFPHYKGRRTLGTVHRLIMRFVEDGDDEDGRLATLHQEMLNNDAAGGAVIDGARGYYDREDRERGSVLSTLRRHLHFLTYDKVKRVLEDGAVDPRRFVETPSTLYLGVPATKLSSCSGLMRLFINLLLAAFESNSARRDFQIQSAGPPCLFIMDEFFAAIGRLDRIEAAAGLSAGFGVKLCPVLQDLSQLKACYPKSWETFLANCGVLSFFGNQDLTTLEWIEKRLGKTQVRNTSQSAVSYNAALKEGASGLSYSMGTHPVMNIAELASTFNRDDALRRQLVLSATHGPLIMQRVFYNHHEAFRGFFGA